MLQYLKAVGLEFIVLLVFCCGLDVALLSGFDATTAMRADVALYGGLSATMLLILCAGERSRGVRVASSVAAVLFYLVALGVSVALLPEGVPLLNKQMVNDVQGNYAIFAFIVLSVAVLSYCLSRSRVGSVILVFAATVCCCVVQFLFPVWLYEEGGMAALFVVMISGLCLLVYRRYMIGFNKAACATAPAFGWALGLGATVSAMVVAVTAALYFAIIAPLGLSTPEIKPFEESINPPVIEYRGTYDTYLVEDENKFSSVLNEREQPTTKNVAGGIAPDEEQTETQNDPLITFLKSMTVFSEDDWNEDFNPYTIEQLTFWGIILALLLAAAVASVFALRYRRREARLRRIQNLPQAEQVRFLYQFLLGRLKRLGFPKPENSTPLEFAFDSRNNLVPFTRNTQGADFVAVTLAYQRATYGGGKSAATSDDLELLKRYYRAFYKNARDHVGGVRWMWYFWRI